MANVVAKPLLVMDVIYARRAVRSYTDDKIDDKTIKQLLSAAVHAPTAMHLEPWSFVVIQDPAQLKRLSDLAKKTMLADVSHHALVRPVNGSSHHTEMLANPDFNIFYDAGTLIVICGRPLGQYVTADCWLAAENLMLAACGLGLGTCPIGFAIPMLNLPQVKAELDIPADVTAVAPIILGMPRTSVPAVARKEPDILHWR